MKLSIRDIILQTIYKFDGEIKSRTQLQKLLYFLGIVTKEDFGFVPYYYGPYSREVESSIGELVGIGFLNEVVNVWGHDSAGFEKKRYDYKITEDGRKISERLKTNNPEDINEINKFLDIVKNVGLPDYKVLSIAAKSYFIINAEDRSINKDEIKMEAQKFDWDLKESEKVMNNAIKFLMDSGLIKES